MVNKQKGFIVPIVVVIVALIIIVGGYIYYNRNNGFETTPLKPIPTSNIPAVVSNLPTSTQQNNDILNINESGIIKSVYTQSGKNYMEIDYVTLNTSWKPGGMSGPAYTNDNKQIRTFEISNDAKYIIDQGKIITLSEFSNLFTVKDYRVANPWDIVITNSVVTQIAEHYLP
jgi:hypothetical protein